MDSFTICRLITFDIFKGMALQPIPCVFTWRHNEFSCAYAYNTIQHNIYRFIGDLGCNRNIFSFWKEWKTIDRNRKKWINTQNSRVTLEPDQVGGTLDELVLWTKNPYITARSYLTNQNNVAKQITIIKWHDIVVEMEICGVDMF